VFLSGEPSALRRAAEYLTSVDHPADAADEGAFAIEDVPVRTFAGWKGRSLATLDLPGRFGVTVLAINSDDGQLSAPDPQRPLSDSDRLLLAGTSDALHRVRTSGGDPASARSEPSHS
jgi:K+/H+ antiporter YhaU regulatory subunit KhtT